MLTSLLQVLHVYFLWHICRVAIIIYKKRHDHKCVWLVHSTNKCVQVYTQFSNAFFLILLLSLILIFIYCRYKCISKIINSRYIILQRNMNSCLEKEETMHCMQSLMSLSNEGFRISKNAFGIVWTTELLSIPVITPKFIMDDERDWWRNLLFRIFIVGECLKLHVTNHFKMFHSWSIWEKE